MKNFYILCCLCLLGGCAALKPPPPPPALYDLHLPPACAQARTETGLLAVSAPRLPPGFGTDRIALYLASGRRMDYYAGAAWPSELGTMLQEYIIAAGRHACSSFSVAAPGEAANGAYRLSVHVNDFEAVYAGGATATPRLRVSLSFLLFSADNGKPVLDFTLHEESAAPGNTLTDIVAGLEALLASVLDKAFRKIYAAAG